MKMKLLVVVCVVTLYAVCAFGFSLNAYSSYTKTIEANRGIDLPESGAKEVYSFSEPSFHGDGIRYHVINYPIGNKSKRILNAVFQLEKIFLHASKPTDKQIEYVESLLGEADIGQDTIPDWKECELVYKTQEDGSELYLFYWSGIGTVYTVESFLIEDCRRNMGVG